MCPASSTMRKNGSSARKSFRWPTEFIRYTRTAQAAAVRHANSVKPVAAPR